MCVRLGACCSETRRSEPRFGGPRKPAKKAEGKEAVPWLWQLGGMVPLCEQLLQRGGGRKEQQPLSQALHLILMTPHGAGV